MISQTTTRWRKLGAACALALVITAPAQGANSAAKTQNTADAQLAQRVIGTWEDKLMPEHAFPFQRAFIDMRSDGSFRAVSIGSVLGEGVRAEFEGSWRVDNGKLIYRLAKSTFPVTTSKVQTHRIVAVNQEELTVEYFGRRSQYRRGQMPQRLPRLVSEVVTMLSDAFRTSNGVSMPKPKYPRTALLQGMQGSGAFLLVCDADGRISSVRVAKSTGSAYLDSAAVGALRQWRFKPGAFQKGLVTFDFVR